jgi:hypothetical protein
MQFHRFLHNPAVTAAEMSRHAGKRTGQRAAGRHIVVVQDTTELVLGSRRSRPGYGSVAKGKAAGLLLHPVLAVEAGTEALLGLVSFQIWNRDRKDLAPRRKRATAAKESQRWIESSRQAGEVLSEAASITMLADRESDIYDCFAERPANVDLIIRACQNRRIDAPEEEPGLLFAFIEAQAEQGRFTTEIPAAPGRRARKAEMAIRYASAKLRRPLHSKDRTLPETSEVMLVDVREVSQPTDGSKPLHWRLLTTHKVASLDDARQVIDLYRMRWTIEEYFRTLKTAGFDLEAADISDPHAMMNLVAAAAIAAVTIKQLVQARDGNTDQMLRDAFDPDDEPILEAVCATLEGKTERQKNPHPKGSLAYASWVIARLGAWSGYYGKPGPKVMRYGLERYYSIKQGVLLRFQNV